MIQLVVFLGNFGREYEKNRHNVAWQFLSSLCFEKYLNYQEKFKGEYASLDTQRLSEILCENKILSKKDGTPIEINETMFSKIHFLKPLTYMNNSGNSIIECANFYKIKPEEILVIHDELELPLGTVSLKFGGGLGGHNGLRSTKAVLNTADFWRIRFGISKPNNINIADYVLSNFLKEEQEILIDVFSQTQFLLSKLLFAKDAKNLIPQWAKKKVIDYEIR